MSLKIKRSFFHGILVGGRMERIVRGLIFAGVSMGLAGCIANFMQQGTSNSMHDGAIKPNAEQTMIAAPEAESKGLIGGQIGSAMGETDRVKMSRGLDNPVGKPATWISSNTGAKYTVMPTRKIHINGNPHCREYSITATMGSHTQQYNGVACIASDGDWHS